MRTLPGSEDIIRQTLPNGITVIVWENPHSPSVVVDAFVHAGSIYEKRPKAGLASYTASMLMRGTKNASFEEIHEKIESGEITRRRDQRHGGAGIIVEQRDGQTATQMIIGQRGQDQ